MYYRWEGAIQAKECKAIIDEFKDCDFIDGEVKEKAHSEMRATSIQWVDQRHLLNRSIQSFVLEANSVFFNYNIETFEPMQFGKYEVGGKYDWHRDALNVTEVMRKLSGIVQLSASDDYEGGDLEFFNGEQTPEDLKLRKQGSVIVFDSRDWHRIMPITKGVRYSLVLWGSGKRFV